MAAINVDLAENRKVRLVFALRKLQNFRISARFLGAKLVTWEGQNRERLTAEFFLQSTQPGVLIGEASATRDVDDQASLTGELIEADIVAVGIGHGDGMECCHYFSSVV